MELKQICISFNHYSDKLGLTAQDQQLLSEAEKATESAYAPYSNFLVGAALLLDNGQIIIGNNQENAAYPSGLCAERVAFFHVSAQYPKLKILKVAIAARRAETHTFLPVNPCGGCLQVMLEYEQKFEQAIQLITQSHDGYIVFNNIASLMPFSFDKKSL